MRGATVEGPRVREVHGVGAHPLEGEHAHHGDDDEQGRKGANSGLRAVRAEQTGHRCRALSTGWREAGHDAA
jgi:hypothetical protein